MKTNKIILMGAIIAFIGIAITSMLYVNYKVVSVEEINFDLEIGNEIGFNIDTDAIHFGRVLPGGNSIKQINLTNNKEFDVLIVIQKKSEINDWIIIGENKFVLVPRENKEVNISIKIPLDTEYDLYEGKIKVISVKA